jgi:hypothetical protein
MRWEMPKRTNKKFAELEWLPWSGGSHTHDYPPRVGRDTLVSIICEDDATFASEAHPAHQFYWDYPDGPNDAGAIKEYAIVSGALPAPQDVIDLFLKAKP